MTTTNNIPEFKNPDIYENNAQNHPAKTLTDEEIHQIFRDESGFEIDTCPIAILDFARAILRKAQEK